MKTDGMRSQIRKLFEVQRLAVLSSERKGRPYPNIIAFTATQDLRHIIFATNQNTRKFGNIETNPNVALLIDNRRNDEQDVSRSFAVTVVGMAAPVHEDQIEYCRDLHIAKHPYLEDFLSSPACRMMIVEVETYSIARFDDVSIWDPRES